MEKKYIVQITDVLIGALRTLSRKAIIGNHLSKTQSNIDITQKKMCKFAEKSENLQAKYPRYLRKKIQWKNTNERITHTMKYRF